MSSIEWGEFRLGDLFEVNSSKKIFHANTLENIYNEQISNSLPYVVRTTKNNGIVGYINENQIYANEANTLSFAQDTFTVFYQKQKYFTGNKVKVLKSKFDLKNSNVMHFLVACFQKVLANLSWGDGSTVTSIKQIKIQLPINKDGDIDFEFMESFVAELEAERVAELEAYLAAASLKDYELTADELSALSKFENYNWGEFRIGDLFIRLNTKKLPYKAKDLPVNVQDKFNLPCLTSSFNNQGLNYFAPRDGATILKNVISLPSNSDVYRGYFQSRDFTVLSDAYVIDWINKETKHKIQSYLFSLTSINKVTDLPIYSYKNKLGGWNVVRNKLIQLPINKDGDIDFEFMNNFIKAIEKLVIKDVVLYADNKIKATKSIVSSNQ